MTNAGEVRTYSVAGLNVAAPFRLPAFPGDARACDVTVRNGAVPASPEGAVSAGRRFQAAPGWWWFAPGDGCRFLVRKGREVLFDVDPGPAAPPLSAHLMQSVLGAVLPQFGILALHASAVVIGGVGVAFIGSRGSGKSTLAAAFHARGYSFVTDDVCPITWEDGPMIAGGVPYLKLTGPARAALGVEGARWGTAEEDAGRDRILLRQEAPEPVPLRRVYLLQADAGSDAPIVLPLSPPRAIDALLTHTYRRQYLPGLGLEAMQFSACARLAAVGVRSLRFPRGLAALSEVAALICDDCRE